MLVRNGFCVNYTVHMSIKLGSIVDPDLHGSRSGIIVPDPAKMKEQINKGLNYNFRPVNFRLFALYDLSIKWKMADSG